MRGFFTREEIEQDFAIENIENPLPSCKKCGLHVGCLHPKTEYTGEGKKKCLIVAEAMGRDEDKVGKQLVGEVGQFLRQCLSEYNLELDRDFWKINAVNCFPHNEHKELISPNRTHVECCRPLVEKAIEETKPDIIWIFGNSALESFFMKDFSTLKIGRWRNTCIPDQKYKAWILPMFHPSYILRNPHDKNLLKCFQWDLKYAISCLKKQKPEEFSPKDGCVCLYKIDEIIELLENVLDNELSITIDYETSGLKPQAPGHKIASIAICKLGDGKACSFPYQYANHFDRQEQVEIKRLMRAILTNERIGKVAHNFKFEHAWSQFILGVEVKNWKWDTMLCAHVLDTRQNFTSLKFQSYIQFGVRPYDKYIKQFLIDKKGTGFNAIDDAPLDSLLMYGAMDAFLTRKLYLQQLERFEMTEEMNEKNKLAKAYRFFHEGNLSFCDIEANGIRMDEKYYEEKEGELKARISSLYRKLAESEQAKEFREQVGRDMCLRGTNSNKDLKKLLTEVLGLQMDRTLKDNVSTDEKSLSQLNLPFTNNLLKIRKLEKIHGTYFAEFKREMFRGKMYPFFSLNIPRSLRSSSSKPNFQNIPNREEEAKKLCRSGIIPSPGNQILESDFKGIEVSIAACYTQDPTLVAHVTNPENDMHRDCAADVWMCNTDQITKDIRFFAKNCWVFPQFYGSYYGNCAEDLWEAVVDPDLKLADGSFVADHIQDHGIDNLDTFKEHCQSVEHDFWNKRFLVYKQWKDMIQEQFRKRGYFETYFGFRFTGYLTYRQLANYPIQGTAFHCLLWTLIRLNEARKRNKWRSKIIGQIHDSIVWDADPDEVEMIIRSTNALGTQQIREENPWIIVPLEIDHEITPIDGSWYEKEEIKWAT